MVKVSASGLFAVGTGFRACSEVSGGFGSLCGPVIEGGSGAHYLSIFSGTDFIQQRLESLRDLRLDGGKCARAEFSSVFVEQCGGLLWVLKNRHR